MDEKKVAYQFRIGGNTEEGLAIEVAGNFFEGTPKDEMNAELDRLVEVISRQRAKALLSKEVYTLEAEKRTLEDTRAKYNELKEANPIKGADKMTVQNLQSNIHSIETQIAQREKGIESLKVLVS
jgi:hypothetical protein